MNQSNLALSLYTSQLNNQSQLKPFSFQLPQNEPFNPILLANTDLENIKLSGYHIILKHQSDLNQAAPLLRNFVSAKFTSDQVERMTFEEFTKLLKVCQVSMDYYMENQDKQE